MGVYIKGMATPKSCLNCFLSRSGCRAVLKRMRAMEAGTWIPANYRHDDCPLVPLPPHGDLIDRDALEKEAQKRMLMCNKNDNQFQKPYEIMRAIALAPTIIPAEEGE